MKLFWDGNGQLIFIIETSIFLKRKFPLHFEHSSNITESYGQWIYPCSWTWFGIKNLCCTTQKANVYRGYVEARRDRPHLILITLLINEYRAWWCSHCMRAIYNVGFACLFSFSIWLAILFIFSALSSHKKKSNLYWKQL